MGVIGKARYWIGKRGGELLKDYGVYEPGSGVPTRAAPPPGYTYSYTTGGDPVLVSSGGADDEGAKYGPSGGAVVQDVLARDLELRRVAQERIDQQARALADRKARDEFSRRLAQQKAAEEQARKQQLVAIKERDVSLGQATGIIKRRTGESPEAWRERRRHLGASVYAGSPEESERFIKAEQKFKTELAKDIQEGKTVEFIPGGARTITPLGEKFLSGSELYIDKSGEVKIRTQPPSQKYFKEPPIKTGDIRRETRQYEPPVTFDQGKIGIWEHIWRQDPTLKKTKQGVLDLGESIEYYASLGGALDYKPSKKKAVISDISITKGTLTYAPPTIKQMTPEQRREYRIGEAELIKGVKFDIATGRIRPSKNEAEMIARVADVKIRKAEKEYGRDILKATYSSSLAKGLGFGAISVIAPPVGWTIASLGVAKIAFEWDKTVEHFSTYPLESWAHVGAGVSGAAIGGGITRFVIPKISGRIRTIGKKFVSPEKIIPKEVLSGKTRYPSAPPEKHLKLFLKSKYKLPGETDLGVWHGSPSKFGKSIIVREGYSETPGLFTAPHLSAQFLKIALKQKYKLLGFNMKSVLDRTTPTALRIYPKGIVKGVKGRKGYVEVLGHGKTEIQGTIATDTRLAFIDSKDYSFFRGTRFTIRRYTGKIEQVGDLPGGTKVTTMGRLTSKYSYEPSRVSVIDVSSILRSVSNVRIPKSSYKISKVSKISYKPSSRLARYDLRLPSYKSGGRVYPTKISYYGITKKATREPIYALASKESLIPPTEPLVFPTPKRVQKKRRDIRIMKGKEDIAISEGFLAKTIGLKPMKIKKKDIIKLTKIPRALGIRRIPQIID